MIEEKLKEIISDNFDIDEDEINEETSSDIVEKWDSLNHLRLVTALEGEFGISLTMDEINNMTSYSKIIELVTKHQNS
jgi:acyl carrier protein